MMYALTNAVILTGTGEVSGKVLLTKGDKILSLTGNNEIPAAAQVIDCDGCYIAPGFIDLQIYGGGGHLFSEKLSAAALKEMADAILHSGTTSFLLTLATNTLEVFEKAIDIVKSNPHPALPGIHFEGPYLNAAKRGAHPEALIRKPDRKEIEALLKKGEGLIKMMTIAPELFSDDILQLLTDYGVVLSAGHSNATYAQGMKAFQRYVTTSTHLFNAMPPLHHREPGLVAAIYNSGDVYASIIADGVHVDYNMIAVSKRLMGDRLFLITDAVDKATTGIYQHVKQADRYTLPDGTLSGSSLTLLQAVANCISKVNIPLEEAVRMASTYPARLMQLSSYGKLEAESKADLVIFSDDFMLKQVFKNGEPVLK